MSNVEEIKKNSRFLRGTIAEELTKDTSHFEESDYQLLKFHGTYQQDDRDLRVELRKQKKERAYMFMVRSKVPAGQLTPEQYLAHDRAASEIGNGTLRITSRQDFQLHGVLKTNLKECIAGLNRSGITTSGACGDVVRNVMAPASPLATPSHRDAVRLAHELKTVFTAETRAYTELWLDGERIELDGNGEDSEPLYGTTYLPRKFKISIAIPPRNDVDIYTHDIGLVPFEEGGGVKGYTVLVGGGFGMTHGKGETHPALAKPLFYIERERVTEACKAIVLTQRDYGNRENRKRARMKYLIEERGLEWFRGEVLSRMESPVQPQEPKELVWTTVSDMLGWHEQGDGKWFLCVWVPEGRIKDTEEAKYKSCFRDLLNTFGFPVRLTPNCNIIFQDIDPSQREAVDNFLAEYGIPKPESLTEVRRQGMACVSLPTCGLGLAESERVFQQVLDEIDKILYELGLEKEQILIRMTGCPNGCARPYNADIAFVGKSPGKYVYFLGGSSGGERLASVEEKMISLEDIPSLVRTQLERFVKERQDGETFSRYWGRTHPNGGAKPEQFHVERAAREA